MIKNTTQKITPFLWFDSNAEEATNFYTSIFKNSEIVSVSRYGEGSPGQAGTVMTTTFILDGQPFMALNGGPHFKFTEAISFFVTWQIVPTALGELLGDPDPEKSKRVMQAMLQMHKIDVEKLKQAHEGR